LTEATQEKTPLQGTERPDARALVIIALTLAAIALALFNTGQGHILYAATCIALIAALAAALGWHPLHEPEVPIAPPGLILILLVAWSALAVTWSVVPYSSVYELGEIGVGLAAYLAWRVLLRDPRVPPVAAAALVMPGLAVALTLLVHARGDRARHVAGDAGREDRRLRCTGSSEGTPTRTHSWRRASICATD